MSQSINLKVQEFSNRCQKMRDNMLADSKVLFHDIVKDLFESNPELNSFSWIQYTPFFNDGDECVFSAHVDYPTVNATLDGNECIFDDYIGSFEVNGEEISSYDDPAKAKLYESQEKKLKNISKSISDLLCDLNQDKVFHMMFGDHVRVVVNRNGSINTEEYDHE